MKTIIHSNKCHFMKWLRSSVISATCCISLLALSSFSTYSADMPEIIKRGYLSVVTEDDYSPFNFMKNGKADGFNADLMPYLKEYFPVKIKQDILPWTGLLPSILQGQYDVGYTGSIVSEDRLKVFNFVAPFGSAQHFYVKRKNDKSIQSLADLNGKTFGIQAGSALVTRLPELKKMLEKTGGKLGKMVEYQSYPEAYADLANGRVDYVINVEISINDLVKKRGKIFEKGFPVSGPGFIAWPIPKDNVELLSSLTAFVNKMDQDGVLSKLQEKWFGGSFKLPKEPITSIEQYRKLTSID